MCNGGTDSQVCDQWLGPGEEAFHPKCTANETPGPWKWGSECIRVSLVKGISKMKGREMERKLCNEIATCHTKQEQQV